MTPPTLDRDERDALVDLMGYRFFAIGARRLDEERQRGVEEEESVARFREDLQLMTDLAWLPRRWLERLGWPEADKADFELSLEPGPLRRALRRAIEDASRAAAGGPDFPDVDEERRQTFERAERACAALLAEIEHRSEESP
ncbi:MAG: hypothetical protein JSU06_00385 [Actinobacteria bacterium]|nr:hypothetical protein [Actinomycetota bacterium]